MSPSLSFNSRVLEPFGAAERYSAGKRLRNPPQINYPPGTVRAQDILCVVRYIKILGWYLTGDSASAKAKASKSPTYAEQIAQYINTKL